MRRFSLSVTLVLAALTLSGCAVLRPDRALRTATGTVAHDLCSETFVSGLDPATTFEESVAPRPGLRWISWTMHYDVDRERREVTASVAGILASRAVHRGRWGCVLVHDDAPFEPPAPKASPEMPALLPFTVDATVVTPRDARLQAALDAAFTEPADRRRQTKAVVILHRGQVIAERYAPGYGVDTPILGFSMTKSVVNALVGILVRDGKLSPTEPAPFASWHTGDDPRRTVTVEHLMRMNSGLALDETGSGFDPSNHMFYLHGDMAAYAQAARLVAEPGQRWFYSSASTHLLARMVRDAAGGTAQAVQGYVERELFQPLGMRSATLEMDTTGTPVGGHYMLASARDWAKFGQLYLQDGMAGNRRLLPQGWVAFSTTATPGTNYGAGWWTAGCTPSAGAVCVDTGLPRGAYTALGNLGQRVAVIPSHELVIVRLGRSHGHGFDVQGFRELVSAAMAAVDRAGER